jgi:hypothetical protein
VPRLIGRIGDVRGACVATPDEAPTAAVIVAVGPVVRETTSWASAGIAALPVNWAVGSCRAWTAPASKYLVEARGGGSPG